MGISWGYIGIMENKMETTIVYWGYNGIMEKKMEATIHSSDLRFCLDPKFPVFHHCYIVLG